MNLEQIANTLKMQPDPVLAQKVQQQDPMQSAIAASLLQQRQQQRAAAAPQQVAPIAQRPPVTQGLYPMIVQAAQNLQRQQAMAPGQGLGAVEPPVMMASGGIVSFQAGGQAEDRGAENTSPFGRGVRSLMDFLKQKSEEGELRARLRSKYGAKAGAPGVFMLQSDEERAAAQEVLSRLGSLSVPEMRAILAQGPSALPLRVTQTGPEMGPPRSDMRPPAPPTGPRPPSTARPAVPGGVTMTTPEMGPPRPDAGIASLVSAAQPMMPAAPIPREDYEGTIARLHEQARPAPAPTEEEILDRQSELERKYGVRPQGEQMIQIMQQQLERARKERERIPQKSLEAAIAGMQGRDLAGMLGSARAAGAGYQQSAEAASQQAEIIYEQAIAKYQDAENERKRGNINEARKKREDAEKLMQQYRAKLAEAQVTGYGQSVQRQVERESIAQREAEAAARDRRERELKEAEFADIERRDERRFEREKALEKLRQSGRVGVGGAGSGVAQGRLDLATTRERATRIEKVLEALVTQNNLTPPAQRKTLDQLYADAERVVRSRYPELFAGEAASSGAAGRGTAPTSVGSYDPSKPADQRVRLPNQ